jgi:hypothetical protein
LKKVSEGQERLKDPFPLKSPTSSLLQKNTPKELKERIESRVERE